MVFIRVSLREAGKAVSLVRGFSLLQIFFRDANQNAATRAAYVRTWRRGYPGGLRVIARPGTKIAVPAARGSFTDFNADREQPTYCDCCPLSHGSTLAHCKDIAERGQNPPDKV